MIAVWDRFMSAAGAVDMPRFMSVAAVVGRAGVRIAVAHFDHMLVHVVSVWMMKVPVMNIINMVTMLNCGMPAAGPMLVRMVLVFWVCAVGHDHPPL